MFLLTLKDNPNDGAYAVQDRYGDKVLFLFQEEDDAVRYALMLEQQEDNEMDVIEVDDILAVATCKKHQYNFISFQLLPSILWTTVMHLYRSVVK